MTSLEEFALWWLAQGKISQPPPDCRVVETDHSLSFPVFRHQGYQVELYVGRPNFTSTRHSHPFDQLIVFNGGEMWGRRGRDLSDDPPWQGLTDKDIGQLQPLLPRGYWHEIRSGSQGFSFYNIQYWFDQEPTSAVIDYQGPSMGPRHDLVIKRASQ